MNQQGIVGKRWDNIRKKAVNSVINCTENEDLIALRVVLIVTENPQSV